MLDGAAGRASILQALGTLKNSKAEDAILLFLSGHGFGNEQDWYFMPSDASFEDPKSWLKATEIRAALEQAGAQRIFVVVDSCYSGVTVDKFNAAVSFQTRFLENGLRGAGVQVLTATRRDQLAPESAELGYWFLTNREFTQRLRQRGYTLSWTNDQGNYADRHKKFAESRYDVMVLPISSYLLHGQASRYPGVIPVALSESKGNRTNGLGVTNVFDARVRIYSLDPRPMAEIKDWLAQTEQLWARQLASFKAHVEKKRK